MTYYPDLDTTSMLGEGVRLRAIGWLHPDHDFARGPVSDLEVELLETVKKGAYQPVVFMGSHTCEFCGASRGYTNLIVPTSELVYVAPEMIVHYIVEHGYQPPAEFLAAIRDCPEQGSPEYMALLAPHLHCFGITSPDPLPTPEQQAKLARLTSEALRDVVRLCRADQVDAAVALAEAFADIPEEMHGWGLWYRHIFARRARNGCEKNRDLLRYLTDYHDVFGENTDPDAAEYLEQEYGYRYP